jgi:hypothetical protein
MLLRASVRGGHRASVGGYVASSVNETAVLQMMSAGFTRAQAEAVISMAKVPMGEASKSATSYVDSEENRLGVETLMEEAGLTEQEAKKVIASGRSVEEVVSNIVSLGGEMLDEQAVTALVAQGLPLATAQALVATGGDPDRLLSLAKDPKQLAEVVKVIDARLRREGIDLSQRVASGLGIDPKMLGTAAKALESVLTIYEAIGAAVSTYDEINYVASRWDESAVQNDESFAGLARALQDMADQSSGQRDAREAAFIQAGAAVAGGLVTFVPPPYGVAAGAAVGLVTYGLAQLGLFEPSVDGNDPKFKPEAEASAADLWKQWQIVPPSFDGSYYTLETYRDVNQQVLHWLALTDGEAPWRERFEGLIYEALHPPKAPEGTKPLVHPAITDLILLRWLPFSFEEWAGGSNFVAGSHWDIGSEGMRFGGFSGVEIPKRLLIGGGGESASPSRGMPSWGGVFNQKAATVEAREGIRRVMPEVVPWVWGNVTVPAPFVGYLVPRSEVLQGLICDRIASAIGTLVAVKAGKPVEPVVYAAVEGSRRAVSMYGGWHPSRAAWRLRDTFLAAEKAAGLGPLPGLDLAPVVLGGLVSRLGNADLRGGMSL